MFDISVAYYLMLSGRHCFELSDESKSDWSGKFSTTLSCASSSCIPEGLASSLITEEVSGMLIDATMIGLMFKDSTNATVESTLGYRLITL